MTQPDTQRRRALGRGLESLLPRFGNGSSVPPSTEADSDQAAAPTASGSPLEVSLEQIEPNPFQTRSRVDDQHLIELGASIAAVGVVQPILLRPLPGGRFQLIAGERRWLASKLIKRSTIPAFVRVVSDVQAMEMTIIENLQRADLNPMEQARAFERLGREFQLTQEQMAVRTGKDRATVTNFLRLLRLPESLQQKVETEELSFGHAKALLPLGDHASMLRVAEKVFTHSMSVRQTETYVHGILHPERRGDPQRLKEPLDPNVREARDLIQRALGLRVTIQDKNGKGKVIIEYSGLEDFDGLVDMLAPDR